MKKISIVIPLYDINEEYIKCCLDSISKQKYADLETIVVDDGSSIDYSNLLKGYNFVNYIKTTNHGVSHARNIGIDMSCGNYIMFVDPDDYLVDNALNEIDTTLDCDYDIILSRTYIVNQKTIINKCGFDDSFCINDKELLHKAIMSNNDKKLSSIDTVWSKLYKKSFLKDENIRFNERLRNCEDVLFNYEAYYKAKKIYFLNKPLYNYRVNDSSACHSFQKDMYSISIMFLKEFKKVLENNDINDPLFPQYVFRILIRLFRKYFIYVDNKTFYNEVNQLLDNDIIMDNINLLNCDELDNYKKELLNLIKNKKDVELEGYLNNVCKKRLLQK